jgi:gamma-glutamyltranspeptidase/glutathione hydrolase
MTDQTPATEPPGWPWLGTYEPHPRLSDARPVISEFGMVSTPHYLASAIGLEVLRSGGNAVDAAVAASAALMVTVPMQCSPGGDAVWVIRSPDGGVEALDATGRSPAAASSKSLRERGLDAVPARSADAVTVPGAVDGWVEALRRHGSRSLAELLKPAAQLAERGFFVSRHLHASFRAALPALNQWGALAIWSPAGSVPGLYSRLQQPALAEALRLIGRTEGRSLYEGELAREIVSAVSASGGALSADDLASHKSEWVMPLAADFRGVTLYTSPPATQGVAMLQAMRVIENLAPTPLDLTSPTATHLMVEAVAGALEDRDHFVTDRNRLNVRPTDLYAPQWIASKAKSIDLRRTGGRQRSIGPTKGRGDTAHLAVVDSQRRAVSLIQSVFFDFGTGIPVKSGGFTLQNRGAGFNLEEGSLNELKPGLRPPHTLTPTLACRGKELALVLGCMGGDGQVQTQVQLLVAMLDAGLDPQQAVSRPRWYLDRASPGSPLLVEEGLDPVLVAGLRQMGHEVSVLGPAEEIMGHAQVIAVERTGALIGAADRRSDGQALGF